MLKKTQSELN